MSEALPGQMSLFENEVATSQLPTGLIRKMKKDLEVTSCRALFAVEAAEKTLQDLSVGKTIGPEGELIAENIDVLCRVAQNIVEALDGLRKLCPDE